VSRTPHYERNLLIKISSKKMFKTAPEQTLRDQFAKESGPGLRHLFFFLQSTQIPERVRRGIFELPAVFHF